MSDKTLDSVDTMVTRTARALCHGAHVSVGVTNNTIKEQVHKKKCQKVIKCWQVMVWIQIGIGTG